MSKKRLLPDDLPQLLETLKSPDTKVQCDTLRRLCPCRSRCYEPEVWLAIFQVYRTSRDEAVCNQAEHAIDTLREYTRTSETARGLVCWLAEEHSIELPDKEPKRGMRRKQVRIDLAYHLPQLVAALEGNDSEAQCNALHQLCPCRNRCYDKEVWLKIFDLQASTIAPRVRDQASHAIDTLLRERVRLDPRSRELVRWLRTQGVLDAVVKPVAVERLQPRLNDTVTNNILPQPDLQIPDWERAARSKTNRRRK